MSVVFAILGLLAGVAIYMDPEVSYAFLVALFDMYVGALTSENEACLYLFCRALKSRQKMTAA